MVDSRPEERRDFFPGNVTNCCFPLLLNLSREAGKTREESPEFCPARRKLD